MRILLLGATGRVGSKIMEHALIDGHYVHVLVRNPDKLLVKSDLLTISVGDARSLTDLQFAARETDVVISCLSTDGANVLSTSVPLIIEVMNNQHIRRIIVVSTAGILQSRASSQLLRYETSESRHSSIRAVTEHRRVWEALRMSDLEWTLVCPTYLPQGPRVGTYRTEVNYLPIEGTSISVGDTAYFTYQQLFTDLYTHQRVGIAY